MYNNHDGGHMFYDGVHISYLTMPLTTAVLICIIQIYIETIVTLLPNYLPLTFIVLLSLPIGLDTVHVYVPMSLVLKLLIV